MNEGMEEGGRTTNDIAKILARVIVIGFGVQIVLGVFWACLQFPHFQEFGESYFLKSVSETLVCDEYVGILYPLVMKLVLGISKVIPIPYYCFLYALQLVAFALSARMFLNAFPAMKKRSKAFGWFATLALTTLPEALQFHVAVLPYSFAASLFLLELGEAIRGIFRGRKASENEKKWELPSYRLTVMGLLWLGEALLCPDYRYFGGILLLGYALYEIFGMTLGTREMTEPERELSKAGFMAVLIVSAVMMGLVPLICSLTVKPGAYGRMGDSLEASLARRSCWYDFGELYGVWPKEIREGLTQDEIAICNKYPERMTLILGEKVDGAYGRSRAREIYGELAKAAWKVRLKRTLREMLGDVAGYALVPAAQLGMMDGSTHSSYFANDYEIMRMKHPVLTSLYVRYGGWLFSGALVISLLMMVSRMVLEKAKQRRGYLRLAAAFIGIGCMFVLFYALRGGGVMDYKNVLPVTVLWATFACCMASHGFDGAGFDGVKK